MLLNVFVFNRKTLISLLFESYPCFFTFCFVEYIFELGSIHDCFTQFVIHKWYLGTSNYFCLDGGVFIDGHVKSDFR